MKLSGSSHWLGLVAGLPLICVLRNGHHGV